MATGWRGIVALPGRRDLQGEGLSGPRGDAGRVGVPPQAAVHLVKVTPHVGFGSKGFEAHWAGFSSRCAESPRPTSSIKNNHSRYDNSLGNTTDNTNTSIELILNAVLTFTFHHREQACGNCSRLCELSELLQFGLVHFAAVTPDAAARVKVLTTQTTGDCHILHLKREQRGEGFD